MSVPTLLLKQLYNFSSLKNVGHGVQFTIKNRLSDAQLTELLSIHIDGREIPKDAIAMDLGDGKTISATQISTATPLPFPLRQNITIQAATEPLAIGKHKLHIGFKTCALRRFKVRGGGRHLRIGPRISFGFPATRRMITPNRLFASGGNLPKNSPASN